jgi:hypothetical protein
MATLKNTTIDDTGFLNLPSGNTAQRPASPVNGAMRYNSQTGFAEVYTNNIWSIIGAPPPTISSVSPTSYTGAANTTITINGSNFTSDAIIYFITNDNTSYQASVTVFSSSVLMTATTPQAFTVAQEPLDVRVVQASGTVTYLDAIDCGGSPSWNTSSGSLGAIYDMSRSQTSFTVSATDPDGSAITYTVVSGSLPPNMSLNSSTGVISGTTSAVLSDTTYSFTIRASDPTPNNTDRAFSIQVKAPVVNTYSYTGSAVNVTFPSNVYNFRVKLWAGAGGQGQYSGGSTTGAGGFTDANVAVSGTTSGQTYILQVGQGGRGGSKSLGTGYQYPRAYPDGGQGYYDGDVAGGQGGGRSALFLSSVSASNAIAIAGGGGGSGYASWSGSAGGGSSGESAIADARQGQPGTQSAGGTGGTGGGGAAGTQLFGGTATGSDGSGGGGGWYGGGSGSNDGGGGGGGSGYVASQTSGSVPSGITTITGSTYVGSGLTPPSQATSDANYPGGNISYGVNTQNTVGYDGYAVIIY